MRFNTSLCIRMCRDFIRKRCSHLKIRQKHYCDVEHSIDYRLFKVCDPRVLRQDVSFQKFLEQIMDPLRSKPVSIRWNGKTIYVFVRFDFKLTREERGRLKGKIPIFHKNNFERSMSNLITRRLRDSVCLSDLTIDGEGLFRDSYWTESISRLNHAIGCGIAILHGLTSFLGGAPMHSATIFRKGGRGSAITTRKNYPLISLVTHFLRKLPKNMEEKEIVKLIKLSFCGNFSQFAHQELPEGFLDKGFSLMPEIMQNYALSRCKNQNDVVRLFFSLQQSKGLCHIVPDTFLKEGLLKHKNGICRPKEETIPIDQELYDGLKRFSSDKVGLYVKESYDPYKTCLPNQRSCFESSRQKQGALGELLSKGRIIRGENPLTFDGRERQEPFVIGFFGPPSSGKSTIIRSLVSRIGAKLFPNISLEELSYSRSCATKHWDGYRNQPIVVMDDFGQSLTEPHDIHEFCQLVSTNPYVLPMASLEEKGLYFSSPIIILTSNLVFGSSFERNGQYLVADPRAIWRRFHLPLQSKVGQVYRLTYQPDNPYLPPCDGFQPLEDSGSSKGYSVGLTYPKSVRDETPIYMGDLIDQICSSLKERSDYHRIKLKGMWVQEVDSLQFVARPKDGQVSVDIQVLESSYSPGVHTYVQFPLEPPEGSPPTKVVALAEPLKVRCITAGEADLKVLQPLQKALWSSLRNFPEFSLTHGISHIDIDEVLSEGEQISRSHEIFKKMECEINRLFKGGKEGYLWLSGDYTAATDNLPMWVTEALLEGILEHIDHEPTKKWARYEIGEHRLVYPSWAEIDDGEQTSGQLMGSLLSFPLLCLANAFIVEYSGIEPGSYLVNGDDIVAYTKQEFIDNWKQNAPRIGLSLSLGKNFISSDFCTVNSQLFCRDYNHRGIIEEMFLKHTGKVSLLKRDGKGIGDTFSHFQQFYGYEDIFRCLYIRNNFHELLDTPCSLSVPRSHAGLGSKFLIGRKVNQKLAKEVYFCTLKQQISCDVGKDFKEITGFDVVYAPYWETQEKNGVKLEDFVKGSERILNRFRSLILPKETTSLRKTSEELVKGDRKGEEGKKEISNQMLHKFRSEMSKDGSPWKSLESIINDPSIRISDLPPLGMFKSEIHFVYPGRYKEAKNFLLTNFLKTFREELRGDSFVESSFYNEDLSLNLFYDLRENPEPLEGLKDGDDGVLKLAEKSVDGHVYLGDPQEILENCFDYYQPLIDTEEYLLDPVQCRECDSRLLPMNLDLSELRPKSSLFDGLDVKV